MRKISIFFVECLAGLNINRTLKVCFVSFENFFADVVLDKRRHGLGVSIAVDGFVPARIHVGLPIKIIHFFPVT